MDFNKSPLTLDTSSQRLVDVSQYEPLRLKMSILSGARFKLWPISALDGKYQTRVIAWWR